MKLGVAKKVRAVWCAYFHLALESKLIVLSSLFLSVSSLCATHFMILAVTDKLEYLEVASTANQVGIVHLKQAKMFLQEVGQRILPVTSSFWRDSHSYTSLPRGRPLGSVQSSSWSLRQVQRFHTRLTLLHITCYQMHQGGCIQHSSRLRPPK